MRCLNCGHCCKYFLVAIVDDPSKVHPKPHPDDNIFEDNVIIHSGETGEPCKHLKGDGPGSYRCEVHDKWWYNQTPCFMYNQDCGEDQSKLCRIGVYMLSKKEGEL
jgi:hypothetical protein